MTFCYIPRFVPYSVSLKEASKYPLAIDGKRIREPLIDIKHREKLQHPQLEMGCPTKLFPLGFRGPHEDEA